MDCPQHESGAGGEDEEDCDGEHFQDLVTKYSFARVSYSRKWKWWWRHILKLINLFEKMSSVNQIIYSFHKYTLNHLNIACAKRKPAQALVPSLTYDISKLFTWLSLNFILDTSWVALYSVVCEYVRHRCHPTKSPHFPIYTGIQALCWPCTT